MTTAFAAHIEKVVGEFLETALVVDDEGLRREPVPVEAADPVAVRSREDLTLVEPPAEQLEAAEALHPLSTSQLINAFADLGVVCGVLAPMKGEEIEHRFLNAAARADLVILDWDMHRDGGTRARTLIKALLQADSATERRRLRVIAIYTGQPGLASIIEQVRAALDEPTDRISPDEMALTTDNVRIVAFGKPLGQSGPHTREVHEADLPARLACEFAALTSGLVPAVALAALASIRNETHRLLDALTAKMDLGYLGHRVASPFPEDAEEHLVAIVAAEIASVLGDNKVGARADIDVIRTWLADARADSPALASGSALDKPRTVQEADLERMLSIGLGRDEVMDGYQDSELNSKTLLKKIRRQGAHLFTNKAEDADASSDVFAVRMATRTLYRRPARVLQLGTVVLLKDDFLVCVQPRCDSVRIDPTEPRSFPFLPLDIADVDKTEHGLVVLHPDKTGLVRLRVRSKPFALRTFTFTADSNTRSVLARNVKGHWSFYATGNRRLRWVAELKPDFGQRVAAELAAEIARIGLDESELVRLSSSGS